MSTKLGKCIKHLLSKDLDGIVDEIVDQMMTVEEKSECTSVCSELRFTNDDQDDN